MFVAGGGTLVIGGGACKGATPGVGAAVPSGALVRVIRGGTATLVGGFCACRPYTSASSVRSAEVVFTIGFYFLAAGVGLGMGRRSTFVFGATTLVPGVGLVAGGVVLAAGGAALVVAAASTAGAAL